MYTTKYETVRIDINSERDLRKYDEILNNPDCHIIREVQEKISNKTFNDEGRIAGLEEQLIRVVTFQKRAFLEE